MTIQFEVKKADVMRAFALIGDVDDKIIELVNKYENEIFAIGDGELSEDVDAKQMALAFAFLIASKIAKAVNL